MKICNECKISKKNKDFWKDKKSKDGLQYRCIDCFKNYTQKNSKRIKKYKRKYYEENIEEKKKYDKLYLEKNRGKINKQAKQYRENNKEKISDYFKTRLKTDPIYRLKKNLRTRIGLAIKTNQKTGKMLDYLGCSIEEFKYYLEEQFYNGMTWDNYGQWHIDHIVPLNEATNSKELYELCHFSNLQPLWAIDNLRKNKYVK